MSQPDVLQHRVYGRTKTSFKSTPAVQSSGYVNVMALVAVCKPYHMLANIMIDTISYKAVNRQRNTYAFHLR